ncbi:MAG TPA: hypothetical protein VFB79_06135 [Candidatus Angelobacter sp.]|nr:hypothetical protein [Candidatus Angelobacter sp.]
MKKLLPSILPILGMLATAVAPAIQDFIVKFVTTHPVGASALTALGFIINHWLPSPTSLPAGSTVAKAGTALMLCFALVLVPMAMTGCTYDQAKVTAAVQNIDNGLRGLQSQIPTANVIIAELQALDPEAAATVQPFVADATSLLPKLITACDTYLQNPGADAYQALLNGIDAFTAQIDQDALKIAQVKNSQSQVKALTAVALFVTGTHVVLGIAKQFATSKQIKAVPTQSARVSFEQIRPFIDRESARKELKGMGYNADAALQAAGF